MTHLGEMMAHVARTVPGAFAFDATKLRLNQGKDGWLLTLVIHPDDYSTDLAMAPIGTQLSVLMVKCDETTGSPPEVEVEPPPPAPSADAKPEKERRPFDALPRAEQAGILCNDKVFRQWLGVKWTVLGGTPEKDAEHIRRNATAAHLRHRLGVASRSMIDDSMEASAIFDQIVKDYRDYRLLQNLPEQRGSR